MAWRSTTCFPGYAPMSRPPSPLLGFAKMIGKAIGKAATDGANGINQAVVIHQKAGEIRGQRYQYAVKRFYYEKLRDFVEA